MITKQQLTRIFKKPKFKVSTVHYIQARDVVSLIAHSQEKIESIKFVAPQIGSNSFGSFKVKLRSSALTDTNGGRIPVAAEYFEVP